MLKGVPRVPEGDSACTGRAGVFPASKQTAALGVLKEEVGACNSCCETCGPRGGACGLGRVLWSGGKISEVSPPPRPLSGGSTQAQLKTARTELGEAQVKLVQQQSALEELSRRGEGGALPGPDPSPHQCPDPGFTSWSLRS